MSKISVNFGNQSYPLPVKEAEQIFLGCTNALVKMGLFQYCQIVDLIEVIRIEPNEGLMTGGQIIVEVVVSEFKFKKDGKKKNGSFVVYLGSDNPIQTFVSNEIIKMTCRLAREIAEEHKNQAQEFSDRLNKQEAAPA